MSSAASGKPTEILIVKEIFSEAPQMQMVVRRLYDLGLYEGVSIVILRKLFFGAVTIIQFEQTILALNKEEMSCLIF